VHTSCELGARPEATPVFFSASNDQDEAWRISRALASGLEDGLTQKPALARMATRSLNGSIAAIGEAITNGEVPKTCY
jgi:hypothetical protein